MSASLQFPPGDATTSIFDAKTGKVIISITTCQANGGSLGADWSPDSTTIALPLASPNDSKISLYRLVEESAAAPDAARTFRAGVRQRN